MQDDRYFLPTELKERLQAVHPDCLVMTIQSLCRRLKASWEATDAQVTVQLEQMTERYEPVKPPDQLMAALEMIHQEEQRLLYDWEVDKVKGLNRARQILESALADYHVEPDWAAMSAFANLKGLVHSRHRTPELIEARNAMRRYYDKRQ